MLELVTTTQDGLHLLSQMRLQMGRDRNNIRPQLALWYNLYYNMWINAHKPRLHGILIRIEINPYSNLPIECELANLNSNPG